MVVLIVGLLAWKFVRDCRRAGTITFDTILFVGYFSGFWLDPLLDFRRQYWTASAYALHLRSWGPYFPGWDGAYPHSQYEGIFSTTGITFAAFYTWVWPTAWLTKRIMRDRPWGWAKRATTIFLIGCVITVAYVLLLLLAQTCAFPATIRDFSFFGGHYYQYSVLDDMSISGVMIVPILLMAQQSELTGKDVWFLRGATRPWQRILAGIGFINLLVFIFMMLQVVFNLSPDPIPADLPGHLHTPPY